MAKIAIPITHGKLSTKFSQCGHFDIIYVDQRNIVAKEQYKGCSETVEELNSWITDNGITDVIVHGIDKKWLTYFSDTKVNLYIGVKINSSDGLINEYLNGTLESNTNILN